MQNVRSNKLEFEKSIFNLIDKYHFIEHEDTFGVAVSGGPDSMFLLYVLNKWANLKKKSLKVFSFDHNLRKDSEKEMVLVEKFTKTLGCKFIRSNWQSKPASSIMEKARIARYSTIAQQCKENNIKTLFLGHHADDIAETISMRILKKSNLDGLCPIFELRELYDIKLLRPLLKICKNQILHFNLMNNIEYINDPSNLNTKYLRPRIRNFLFNEKKLKVNLIKASYLFCKIRKYNIKFIKVKFQDFFVFESEGFLKIDRIILKNYPDFLVIKFLKIAIHRLGNKKYFSKPKKLNDIYLKASSNEKFIISLGGCIIDFKEKNICIYREYNDIKNKIYIIKENSRINWDNRFKIINNTSLKLKVLPVGKILDNTFYRKKFKLNKKIIKSLPFNARKTLPVIITLEGLLYVPHLNISELNLSEKGIKCQTIDFFDKKYDNI